MPDIEIGAETTPDDVALGETGPPDVAVEVTGFETVADAVADASVADASIDDASVDVPPSDTVPSDIPVADLPKFSFFVTSIESMQRLSGSPDGFGGDLRFGEATGLAGADKICTTIADTELPGAGAKRWHAYLSAVDDGQGNNVHAIERIGTGPWYDRNGRLVAADLPGLRSTRPAGDATLKDDLPNERGEGQKSQPGPGAQGTADNHDVLTASNSAGLLDTALKANTCQDWTDASTSGRPRLGHSWPAMSGQGWAAAHPAAGCAAVVNILQNGPGAQDCKGVGCGGGYGAIYCFAEVP